MPELINQYDDCDDDDNDSTDSGIQNNATKIQRVNKIPDKITGDGQKHDEDEISVISLFKESIEPMRIRGGAQQETEENEEERFILEELDEDESEPIGRRMDEPKLPDMIRISGCNPNGIKANQLKSHIQNAMDLQADIQCYSEVNTDFLQTKQRQQFYENTKVMDIQARSVWGTSHVVVDNNSAFKPGGTAIVAMGKTAGRVKKLGIDSMGRRTYQLLDGKGEKIYQ
jgi:hypothetical protein